MDILSLIVGVIIGYMAALLHGALLHVTKKHEED